MLENITKILQDYKSNDSLVITEQTTFESLALDSLDMVELVMLVEDDLSVKIEMSADLKSVGDLMRIIESAQ